MEAMLHETAHFVALFIEAIAIAIIAIGAVEAVIGIVRVGLRGGATNSRARSDQRNRVTAVLLLLLDRFLLLGGVLRLLLLLLGGLVCHGPFSWARGVLTPTHAKIR